MGVFRRFNTMYYRLLSTYIVLTVFVTTAIGVVAYRSFSRGFQEEADRLYSKVLGQFDHTLDVSLAQKTNRIYGSLIMDTGSNIPFLMNNPPRGNSEKVLSVYRLLLDTVANNSDLLDSIQVFFERSGLLVSSQGAVYAMDGGRRDPFIDTRWVDQLNASGRQSLWLESSNAATGARTLMLAKTVPNPTTQANRTGAIGINVREDALRDLIRVTGIDQIFRFVILDERGAVVITGDGVDGAVVTEAFVQEVLGIGEAGHFTHEVAGVDSLVYAGTLSIPTWRYAAIISLSELYPQTRVVGQTLLVCCVGAIAVGILAANLFSMRLYSPLKAIVSRLSGRGRPPKGMPANEYALINETINALSLKVNTLERTLSDNRALIEHGILDSLLRGKRDVPGLTAQMRSVGMALESGAYMVVLFRAPRAYMAHLSAENALFIKYNLMDRLRAHDTAACYPIETEDGMIAAVLCADAPPEALTRDALRLSGEVREHAATQFAMSLQAAAGSVEETPEAVHLSYEGALDALRALYFWPGRAVITHAEVAAMREGPEASVERMLNEFQRSVHYGNRAQIHKSAGALLDHFRQTPIPHEYAYQKLTEMVLLYIRLLKSTQGDVVGPFCDGLYAEFGAVEDIDQLRTWFFDAMDRAAALLDESAQAGSAKAVRAAQAYIQANLQSDLSLTDIAESVGLSPNYLGKLFKEATGRSCLTYIMELRMARASTLLTSTQMKVEEVALSVGYNNPAYFIKLFKQAYGVTPKQMRLAHSLEGMDREGEA